MVGKQKLKEGELGSRPPLMKRRCVNAAMQFHFRVTLVEMRKSWKHWKEEDRDNENEAEHRWSEEVRPKWTANVVAAGDGMKVVNTEEIQQYVPCVNTWKSKPEVFRMAEEVDVGGIEDESGSSEESRSGNEKQACFLSVPACIISSRYHRVPGSWLNHHVQANGWSLPETCLPSVQKVARRTPGKKYQKEGKPGCMK